MCTEENADLPGTSGVKDLESVLVIPDGATIKISQPVTVSSPAMKRRIVINTKTGKVYSSTQVQSPQDVTDGGSTGKTNC